MRNGNGTNGHAKLGGGSDPLLAALIAKLPSAGTPWPRADRLSWLQMVAMSFDVVYGRDGEALDVLGFAPQRQASQPAAPASPAAPPRAAHVGHDFYVDQHGMVCNAEGTPVLITDVPTEATIFDYRPVTGDFRDLASLSWADGTRGTAGIAPGVSFCGPG